MLQILYQCHISFLLYMYLFLFIHSLFFILYIYVFILFRFVYSLFYNWVFYTTDKWAMTYIYDITRIALFLVERIVFFSVFRRQNTTPFSHGVMYKFCHPRYNLSVVTSHQKYDFFTIIETTKIWKFVSNFSKEIEALDFKHLAAC